MTEQPKLIECKVNVMSDLDCAITARNLKEKIDRMIETVGVQEEDVMFELVKHYDKGYTDCMLEMRYKRLERPHEVEARIAEEKRKAYLDQKRQRQAKRDKLKENFLAGMMSAKRYEEEMAKIPPG